MALRGALGGGNDGLGSASNVATLTLPAGCQPGDVALFITVSNLGTSGSVTGTSPACVSDSGPDVISGNNTAYVMHRTLTAGDIATGTITITWNASGRVLASGQVWSGLDATNLIIAHSTTTSTPANLPTVQTTTDNAQVVALTSARVSSGSAAVATFPTGYTTDNSAKTSFSSGVQFGCSAAHRTTTGPAGTYGGGSVSWSGTFTNANMYVVGIPAAATLAPSAGTPADQGITLTATQPTGTAPAVPVAAGTPAGQSITLSVTQPVGTAPSVPAAAGTPAAQTITLSVTNPTGTTPTVAPAAGTPAEQTITLTATSPAGTAPTVGVNGGTPADQTITLTTTAPTGTADLGGTPTDQTITVTVTNPVGSAPAAGVASGVPADQTITLTVTQPVGTAPHVGAARNITIIAGPVSFGWSAGAPTQGWSADSISGNHWTGSPPTQGWSAATVET